MYVVINDKRLRVQKANTFMLRLKGLLGCKDMGNKAYVLYPCRAVHTWFMNLPIDVLFLDRDGRVIHFIRNMQPFRLSPIVPGAFFTVEMPCGTLPKDGIPRVAFVLQEEREIGLV